jgi:Tol biopolymer transport system component
MRSCICTLCLLLWVMAAAAAVGAEPQTSPVDPVAKLAEEVKSLGWIVFSARSASGDFDLYLSRPDGSDLRRLTDTREYHELGGRFSPDGTKMLYRRLPRRVRFDHTEWGALGELVLADADGANPVVLGANRQFPTATWGPDGKQIACLHIREGVIRVYDLTTKAMVMERPRQGIFRQLSWSADGRAWVGSADVDGLDWNIVSIDIATGQRTLLSRGTCCTPDWVQGGSQRVVYSHGQGLERDDGWNVIMVATADGKSRSLLYGERGRHIYYACTSPDAQYVIFSRRLRNDGPAEGEMAIIRMADAPIVVGGTESYDALMREQYGAFNSGPVLHLTRLPAGFEPHWADAKVGARP